MGDLAAFERMCEVVINGSRDPAAYENANQQTMALGETPDNIGLLQSVFEASTNSCAIHVAANCLNKLVTDFWTSFTDSNRVEIRECRGQAPDRDALAADSWRPATAATMGGQRRAVNHGAAGGGQLAGSDDAPAAGGSCRPQQRQQRRQLAVSNRGGVLAAGRGAAVWR